MGCYFSYFTTASRDVSITETFPETYSDIRLIHKGSSRRVYKCTSGEKTLCCKVIPALPQEWHGEYTLLLHIIANGLPSPIFTNIIKQKGFVYLFYEYIEGDDMFQYLEKHKKLTEGLVRTVMSKLIRLVSKYHAKSVWHLDLKPENIICIGGNIENLCLIDVGQSVICRDTTMEVKSLGTPRYSAPELSRGRCNSRTDVWSIGVIAYVLMFRSYPSMSRVERGETILKGGGSKMFVDFVTRCLEHSMHKRSSLSNLSRHGWFTNFSNV